MLVTHESWLVALSVAVAIQGAYVGLSLAAQVAEAVGVHRRLLLAGASFSVAVAIWSMHFVAMLAARLPFPVDYLVFPTLLSFLVCVLVVGIGVFAATTGPPTHARLAAAAVFVGLGIVSMHYIGMWALHASAHMTHAMPYVAASIAIAVAVSGLALVLAGGRHGRPPLVLSAVALGLAISGMHYTAMAGVRLMPLGDASTGAPALSTDLLAIVVAIVAFAVSGIFLLTLVPERQARRWSRAEAAARAAEPMPHAAGGDVVTRDISVGAVQEAVAAEVAPASSLPPRVAAATVQPAATEVPPALAEAGAAPARRLPVVRAGANRFVAVKDIVAVHANAHYTTIFDGATQLFCPLPIGEVQTRLDGPPFVRVHRSHIVNIERVAALKRRGDHGLIELAGRNSYTVPVSRSRYGGLKSQLGREPGAGPAS